MCALSRKLCSFDHQTRYRPLRSPPVLVVMCLLCKGRPSHPLPSTSNKPLNFQLLRTIGPFRYHGRYRSTFEMKSDVSKAPQLSQKGKKQLQCTILFYITFSKPQNGVLLPPGESVLAHMPRTSMSLIRTVSQDTRFGTFA